MQSAEVHCKQKHHTRQWLPLFDLVLLPGKLAFSKKKKKSNLEKQAVCFREEKHF